MESIIIIDDEKSICEFLSIMLRKEGYKVSYATNPLHALSMIENDIFDLAIVDIKMPVMDGLTVLRKIKELSPDTVVIIITAYASTKTAVQAIKDGAYEYLTKPFTDNEEVKLIIRNAVEKKRLRDENIALKRELSDKYGFGNLIGKSTQMKQVFDLIQKIANTRSTVLISGESGTGKELVARAIHFYSNNRDKSFRVINCGAMPEGLLESELFGHIKGAFTGAINNKKGLFEEAHKGTLFLDEIATTPIAIQIKLLRALQDGEIRRVGSNDSIKVDARILAATNQDLKEAINEGTFREDLYYRLNVIPIVLPPLRERIGDIPLLTKHFIEKYAKKIGFLDMELEPSHKVVKILSNYHWPGNVRELENVIERAVTLGDGKLIATEDLPEHILYPVSTATKYKHFDFSNGVNLEEILNDTEERLLALALEKAHGNKTKAAQILNLSFRSFRYRLQKYDHLNQDDTD